MDSHVFRCVGQELVRLLSGARVEKIHEPLPGFLIFTVFAAGEKRRLALFADRSRPLLLFARDLPANPARPSAGVMRLRKYVAGRRLGEGAADFVRRRLAFALPQASSNQNNSHDEYLEGQSPSRPPRQGSASPASPISGRRYLLLDLREGASIVPELPADFSEPPLWPDADLVTSLCLAPGCRPPDGKKESAGPWTEYPVLTPLLRETLAELEAPEGRALLVDLEAGGGELFLYENGDGALAVYSAWPLPEAVLARRGLVPASATPEAAPLRGEAFARDFPCLALVSLIDAPAFHAAVGTALAQEETLEDKRERKRLSRLWDKLTQEEERLRSLTALKEEALLLQENLWRYPAEAKFAQLCLPGTTLSLDPLLSVRDNMARMFHQAARGERGLAMLAKRKAEVAAEAARAMSARQSLDPRYSGENGGSRGIMPLVGESEGTKSPQELLVEEDSRREGKDVARFRSSDGFVILRGKNARGNQALLKIGQPYDYWLHAEDGPSAHALIRRTHAAQEVPERTLLEAGCLVGKKSRYRDDSRARIMLAALRHVHPIKGATPGTVRVDVVARVFVVSLDKE